MFEGMDTTSGKLEFVFRVRSILSLGPMW